jgi:hypothetical protein
MEEKIKELSNKIEELRVYLNNPLDSSQDITDLTLRQIIDLEIDNKGYLIDYIEFEKLQAELKGYLLGQSDKEKEIEYRLKENNMQHNFECGVKIGVEQGQSDYKKKVKDEINKLKEDIKLNWKHYQYNYNPAGSEKRKRELLSKIDNLLKELEIK